MSFTYHCRGIVLLREDWREAGRLYTLYTREAGKVLAVGRGTRKPLSKLAAHLEPYSTVDLHLARGRKTETICGALVSRTSEPISSDSARHLLAAFIAETVDHFVKFGDPDAELWNLVENALAGAAREPIERFPELAAAFSWRLMDRLGYHPRIEHCASCERDSGFGGLFLPLRGVMLCADCRPPERELAGAAPLDRSAVIAVRACLETEDLTPDFYRAVPAGLLFLEAHLDRPISTLPLVRQALMPSPISATVSAL